MEKRRMRTRKRTALHWLAALCLLIAACHVLGVYCLTPERALRNYERESFTGETSFLTSVEPPSSRRDLRLSVGEKAVVLARYGFSLRKGWYVEEPRAAAREPDCPLTAAYYSWVSYRTDPCIFYYYVFGCLEDGAVTELELVFNAEGDGYEQTVRLTDEDWIVDENGDRMFLCALTPMVNAYNASCSITGCLADGTVAWMQTL